MLCKPEQNLGILRPKGTSAPFSLPHQSACTRSSGTHLVPGYRFFTGFCLGDRSGFLSEPNLGPLSLKEFQLGGV